jgi:hypothetical protein
MEQQTPTRHRPDWQMPSEAHGVPGDSFATHSTRSRTGSLGSRNHRPAVQFTQLPLPVPHAVQLGGAALVQQLPPMHDPDAHCAALVQIDPAASSGAQAPSLFSAYPDAHSAQAPAPPTLHARHCGNADAQHAVRHTALAHCPGAAQRVPLGSNCAHHAVAFKK